MQETNNHNVTDKVFCFMALFGETSNLPNHLKLLAPLTKLLYFYNTGTQLASKISHDFMNLANYISISHFTSSVSSAWASKSFW